MKVWTVIAVDEEGKPLEEYCEVFFSPQEAEQRQEELKAAGLSAGIVEGFLCGSGY